MQFSCQVENMTTIIQKTILYDFNGNFTTFTGILLAFMLSNNPWIRLMNPLMHHYRTK